MSITQALKWSFLSEVASKAVQPFVFVILARLLTPEDYGVVAAATMVISFSQIFWEAGMAKAIIQYQGERLVAANTAFWVNNVLGIFVALALVACSGLVADRIFHDQRVAQVLQFMALQVVLSASVSVHTALLQKDMQFKQLFWVRLVTVTIPGLISIPLAWYGMGYWALVAGTLSGQVVQVALLWEKNPWKPSFSFDPIIAKKLARFGGWVAATGLLAWFYVWADSLIVGIYLGPEKLGLYRTGNAFVMMIFGFLFSPLTPVLYSYFSEVQADRKHVREVLLKVIKIITLVSIPMGFLLYVSSHQISTLIFGDAWHGIGFVIGITAVAHSFAWIVGINAEAYRSIGRPDVETKILAITFLSHFTVYIISIQYGFEAFLWGRLLCVALGLIVHFLFCGSMFELPFKRQAAPVVKSTVPLIPAAIFAYCFVWSGGPTMLLVYSLLWVVLISAGTLYFQRELLIDVLKARWR